VRISNSYYSILSKQQGVASYQLILPLKKNVKASTLSLFNLMHTNSKKMKTTKFTLAVFVILLLSGITYSLKAQSANDPDPGKLSDTILHLDSMFWEAYNSCNTDKMESFFTEDLEFYHDKGGLTITSAKVLETTKKNLCSNENSRLRREAVPGSLQVYPINNYGAIFSGEHLFYVLESGKKERLDGIAKFTHIWEYKNSEWKMSRILSYDHRPANTNSTKKTAILPDDVLSRYVGKYEGAQIKLITVNKNNEGLELQAGEFKGNIFAESEKLFFFKERDLTFEFHKNSKNKIEKLIVRENGEVVEEAKKIK
jgi:hypothetical protein